MLSFLGGGRKSSRQSAKRQICLVDGTSLAVGRARSANWVPSPREQYMALSELAQFAAREQIKVIAVFIGRPLREAANGEEYKGVKVYYAEDQQQQAERLLEIIKQNRRMYEVVLICADAELERKAGTLKAVCMRTATLKKAFDDRQERGGDAESERTQRRRRGRGSNGRRSSADKAQSRTGAEQKATQQESAKPESAGPSSTAASENISTPSDPEVLSLIDPL